MYRSQKSGSRPHKKLAKMLTDQHTAPDISGSIEMPQQILLTHGVKYVIYIITKLLYLFSSAGRQVCAHPHHDFCRELRVDRKPWLSHAAAHWMI